MSNPNFYPPGLEEEAPGQIAEFYDSLTEEEWGAHDEYAYERDGYTDIVVPKDLMPSILTLIDQAEDHRRLFGVNDPDPAPAALPAPQEGNFPPGWNSERVQHLIAETEEEEANWTDEDEAELQERMKGKASILVPDEIVPAVEALVANHQAETAATD